MCRYHYEFKYVYFLYTVTNKFTETFIVDTVATTKERIYSNQLLWLTDNQFFN